MLDKIEMIGFFRHNIFRDIIKEIQSMNECFVVIVDGTQDISGEEQASIWLKHVDSNLNIHEDFMGLYEIPSTTSDVHVGAKDIGCLDSVWTVCGQAACPNI